MAKDSDVNKWLADAIDEAVETFKQQVSRDYKALIAKLEGSTFKTSGSPPMPEPVEVWPWRLDSKEPWCFANYKADIAFRTYEELSFKYIPGMMSTDELWSMSLWVGPASGNRWMVAGSKGVLTGTYSTALEAQWAATCLAKEKSS